ncbi:MAG: radical SAM family heme chaperone HemW [Alphaproteobacteria bacterium]
MPSLNGSKVANGKIKPGIKNNRKSHSKSRSKSNTVPMQPLNTPPPPPPPPPPLGLYVHWPFCLSKCPYCDFNSYTKARVPQQKWRQALSGELTSSRQLWPRQKLASIFFGGGTPSRMAPETIAEIIQQASSLWIPTPNMEITLECNPGDVTKERLRLWADAGVNRISIGVQSFNDPILRFLGRRHNAEQARRALKWTASHFQRFSLDLIYCHPNQTLKQWQDDLDEGLSFGSEHLSAYELTIEENTPFYQAAKRGRLILPAEDARLKLRRETIARLKNAELDEYEVSNYARGGAVCRHNLNIWNGGDYIALGPGAHGRGSVRKSSDDSHPHANRFAVLRTPNPDLWLQRACHDSKCEPLCVPLSWRERRDEAFLLAMRTHSGLTRNHLLRESGTQDFAKALGSSHNLTSAQEQGWLREDLQGLRATPSGLERLDGLLARLLESVPVTVTTPVAASVNATASPTSLP